MNDIWNNIRRSIGLSWRSGLGGRSGFSWRRGMRWRGGLSWLSGGFEHEQRLTDLDGIPFFNQHTGNATAGRTRHFNHCFVGFNFEQRLAWLDDIACRDKNRDDIAGGDIFPKIGQFKFCGHKK